MNNMVQLIEGYGAWRMVECIMGERGDDIKEQLMAIYQEKKDLSGLVGGFEEELEKVEVREGDIKELMGNNERLEAEVETVKNKVEVLTNIGKMEQE